MRELRQVTEAELWRTPLPENVLEMAHNSARFLAQGADDVTFFTDRVDVVMISWRGKKDVEFELRITRAMVVAAR